LSAPVARRAFLAGSAAAAVAGWLGPAAEALCAEIAAGHGERLLGIVPFVGEGPFPVETTIGAGLGRRRALDLSSLSRETLRTPQERFFVRTGAPEPLPDSRSWTIRVHGLVESPGEIAVEALRRDETARGVHLLECAGNSRAAHFGFMSAASWSGVPLTRVLKRHRPRATATQVLVSGFDGHTAGDPGSAPGASWIFGLQEIRASGAFLATRMNGAALQPDHGHPVRLVVPGWYGCTAIKWVNEIALVDDAAAATGHMLEFAARTHQTPIDGPRRARDFQPATIDPAALPVRVEKVEAGGRAFYRVVGIVWGARASLRGLKIRLNPDLGFAPVERIASAPGTAWALWSHTFQPPVPGRYRIELALLDPTPRARRLDSGFYAREIEIPRPSGESFLNPHRKLDTALDTPYLPRTV
jgi:DMSO/TMAO reductase YedYZ molybdopterin-dependent catalytic subunit